MLNDFSENFNKEIKNIKMEIEKKRNEEYTN